jgi:hypothetical protein
MSGSRTDYEIGVTAPFRLDLTVSVLRRFAVRDQRICFSMYLRRVNEQSDALWRAASFRHKVNHARRLIAARYPEERAIVSSR